jgi:LysR family glycine cleavage system transcriptional activator/LysR family transcriptional regulator of beta-lactamase
MRRRFSLTALRAFEAAARTGSFSAAAGELSVTRPAVSKQVRQLEEELGCPLFDRRGNGLAATLAGRELFIGLTQSFDLIALTLDRLSGRSARAGRVRVLVERDFASAWLAEHVGQFLLDSNGAAVEIVAERNGVFHMDEDYSYRIFYGGTAAPVDDRLEKRELCRWVDLPLCTADYARAIRRRKDRALDEAHLLHDRSHAPWIAWLESAGDAERAGAVSGTVFNETSLCLSAALAGSGIAIGDTFLAFRHIETGMLIPPFSLGVRSREAYFLYRRKDAGSTPAERAFEQWILAALGSHEVMAANLLSRLGVDVVD